MKKHVRLNATTDKGVSAELANFVKGRLALIFSNSLGLGGGGNDFWITKKTGTKAFTTTVYDGGSAMYVQTQMTYREVAIGLHYNSEKTKDPSGGYTIDVWYDELEGCYFHIERATGGGDRVPLDIVGGHWIAKFNSKEPGDTWLYSRYGDYTVNHFYTDIPNTFTTLSNFAIPEGHIALWNPGSGQYFFEKAYCQANKIDMFSVAAYSYQTIPGLGTFFVLPGNIWVKED